MTRTRLADVVHAVNATFDELTGELPGAYVEIAAHFADEEGRELTFRVSLTDADADAGADAEDESDEDES